MTTFLAQLALVAAWVADETPKPEDVKAGWGAFALFIALAVAVALLGWSMSRHLRKARANADAGAFGPVDEPSDPSRQNAS